MLILNSKHTWSVLILTSVVFFFQQQTITAFAFSVNISNSHSTLEFNSVFSTLDRIMIKQIDLEKGFIFEYGMKNWTGW